MTDPVTCGAQQVMAALIPPVYFTRIDLLGALSSLAARATAKHGLDDAGALLFTLLAVLVHGIYNELEESLAYGKAAIQFFEQHGGTPLACPAYKVYSSHIAPWSMPIRDTLPSFRTSIAYGIEYRDAEYVGFGCAELCGKPSLCRRRPQRFADPRSLGLTAYSIFCVSAVDAGPGGAPPLTVPFRSQGVPLPEISSNLERFTVLVRKFRHELSTLCKPPSASDF